MEEFKKIIKQIYLYFVKKSCFEVYYTDKKGEKEGRICVWLKDVDEVEPYFEKHFPQLVLYDIGEIKNK